MGVRTPVDGLSLGSILKIGPHVVRIQVTRAWLEDPHGELPADAHFSSMET